MTAAPTTADAPAVRDFADFGVDRRICAALEHHGITTPFPIQELTLPLALSGADLIGQARTGTGKTLAFGIPLLERVDPTSTAPQALVIVPTRELCMQVREDLATAAAELGTRAVAVYGGKAIDAQIHSIRRGAPVVVGTPGRLLDLMRRGILELSAVSTLVLDEADEMLDLGFLPDVEQLIAATAEQRQTMLFSATMPSAVVALARRYMSKPTFLRADVEEARIAPATRQYFFSCHRMDKPAVLARILQSPDRGLCVVFTRTKRMADVLAKELRDLDVDATPIHSDLRQEARERALSRFRSGKVDVLVATEVAARGLDITDVTHVVNYDCPDDEKMYLHRIGRTGRAGAAGAAVTLAVWNELARLDVIKKALAIDEPTHEVFSTSPILDELFNLPARDRKPARTASREDAGTADADADTDAQDVPPRRSSSRRRSRLGRSAARPAGVAGDQAPAGAAEPAAPDAERHDDVRRVRVRRRRRAAEPLPEDAAGTAAAEAPAADGAEATGRRERPQAEGSGGRADDGRRGKQPPAETAAGRPEAPNEGPPTPDEPATGPGRSRRRGGRGRRAGGRRGRSSGRGPQPPADAADREDRPVPANGDTGDEAASPNDVAALRGDGQPRLRRPLVISHLP